MADQWKNKSNRIIDLFILFCGLISLAASIIIFYMEPGVMKSLFNIEIPVALMFLALTIFREKLSLEWKTLLFIAIGVYVSIHSLFDGGSTRAVIPVMTIYLITAYLYLSRMKAIALSIFSILIFIAYGIAVEQQWLTPKTSLMEASRHFSFWLYQSLLMALSITIAGTIILFMRREQERYIRLLEKRAYRDPVTGLKNYQGMNVFVQNRIEREPEKKGYFVLLDIRNFRLINSLYEREYGDKILQVIGNLLLSYQEDDISASRLSDDEFCLWIETSALLQPVLYLSEFSRRLDEKMAQMDRTVNLLFYKSIASYPEHGKNFHELFSHASLALKEAKNRKDYSFVWYHPDQERKSAFDDRMTSEIGKAMQEDEFCMVYQNKVHREENRVIGVEALVRWESKKMRHISPDEFIPVIRKSNLIFPFTRYIIEKVLREIPGLKEILGEDISVSINIPPSFFFNKGIVKTMEELLSLYAVPHGTLVFEITEDIYIEDKTKINGIIEKLRNLGICFALDDFGKGYSSLSYLQTIKIDELKIDKSFIDHISLDEKSREMFHLICSIAEVYGFSVVAEGVENKEQAQTVFESGCSIIQGFYYSRPSSLKELSSSIKKT